MLSVVSIQWLCMLFQTYRLVLCKRRDVESDLELQGVREHILEVARHSAAEADMLAS